MGNEYCVNSCLDNVVFGLVRKKKRQKVRGRDKAVDIGGDAFAMGTYGIGLLLQSLQSPTGSSVDISWFRTRGAWSAGRDSLEVAGPVAE